MSHPPPQQSYKCTGDQQPHPSGAPPPVAHGTQQYPPQQTGVPPGVPPQIGFVGYPPPQQQGYPPQQGNVRYPAAPPHQQGFPTQQGQGAAGYPPPQQRYPPPQQQGYPPQQGNVQYPAAPPHQQGFPTQQAQGAAGYPPPQQRYPHPQQGYPPQQQGYPPQHGYVGYPPAAPQQGQGDAGQVQHMQMPQLGQSAGQPVQSAGQPCQTSQGAQPDEKPNYESLSFDVGSPIPPPSSEPPTEETRPEEIYLSTDELSEQAVRDAVSTFVDKHCCYGSRPAKQMSFTSIVPSSGLHYILDTFTEGRSTRTAHVPNDGSPVDGPFNGMPPQPWQIHCTPTTEFKSDEKVLEVPHTSVIKNCFQCHGQGSEACEKCTGTGKIDCWQCGGKGYSRTSHTSGTGSHRHTTYRNLKCMWCKGTGKKNCSKCEGSGQITCPICTGLRTLRHFIELVVQYTNHMSDYILEETDMPKELVRDVSGRVVFEQDLPCVWPISQYPEQQINDNSIRLVNEHREAWPNEKIIKQRQVLRSVPVSEVAYTWKDHNKRFWVYGYEHEVHAPDYPHQCCWGCNVL